jgi:hypothetical protein
MRIRRAPSTTRVRRPSRSGAPRTPSSEVRDNLLAVRRADRAQEVPYGPRRTGGGAARPRGARVRRSPSTSPAPARAVGRLRAKTIVVSLVLLGLDPSQPPQKAPGARHRKHVLIHRACEDHSLGHTPRRGGRRATQGMTRARTWKDMPMGEFVPPQPRSPKTAFGPRLSAPGRRPAARAERFVHRVVRPAARSSPAASALPPVRARRCLRCARARKDNSTPE